MTRNERARLAASKAQSSLRALDGSREVVDWQRRIRPRGAVREQRKSWSVTIAEAVSSIRSLDVANLLLSRPSVVSVSIVLIGVTLLTSAVLAQTTSAKLTGVVRSKSGEPAVGAVVEARSEETGAVRGAVSDSRGAYQIDLLTPGAWRVSASLGGGEKSEARSVTLRLQQTQRVDLTLGSGITETVTVSGEAPLLDPSQTGGELLMTGSQADNLPLAGRVVTDLAQLDAAIRPTPPGNFYGERGSVFVVNGQSGRSNSFLVDGLDNNDRSSGTTLNAFFSQLVIREFVVLTHQFSPEFGRAAGGVLNIITERGTNELGGDVFAQGTSSGWNDRGEFVSSLPSPEDSQGATSRYQGGFRLGGPIRPEKSFYFLAFEHQKSREVVPFTGVTRDGVAGGWAIAPNRDDNLFFRTDFNLSPTHSLMVRLSGDDRVTSDLNVGGIATPETGFKLKERDGQLAASLTSVISSNLLNEARFLSAASRFDQFANSERPGVERPSGAFGGNNLNRQNRDENRLQLVDNVTWQARSHTFKLGLDVARTHTDVSTAFNPSGNFTYNTDRPFEPGDGYVRGVNKCAFAGDTIVPCPGNPGVDDDGDGSIDEPADTSTYPVVYQLISGRPRARLHDLQAGLFVQDTWQAGSKLLLDYGLRYDVSTFTLPKTAAVESRIPNGGAGIDKDNIAPRLGFTFQPGAPGRLLIRGGAGVFYDKLVMGFPAVASITSGTKIGLTFPQGLAFEITEKVVEKYGVKAVKADIVFPEQLILRFSTGTRLDTPYTTLFNLGMETSVGPHGSIRADVVRAQGYHLPLFRDLNPPKGVDLLGLPNHSADPSVGSIAAIVTEGRSWYNGLELAWRWRGRGGWWAASYTLSKAEDLGPDPLKGGIYLPQSENLADEKGRSDSDRRHRVVLSGECGLPLMGLRLSGVFQASSGVPFNVTTGTDDNLDGITSDRPHGVGRNTGSDTPLGPVNRLRAENGLPRIESLDEPDFLQLDLRLWKSFLLKKDGKAEAAVFLQVFNVFDRFNEGPVEGRVTSRKFGEPIGQVGPPRTIETGLRASF